MASRNYFVCTLGEASDISGRYHNANHLLQDQSRNNPDLPAIGFYETIHSGVGESCYTGKVLSFKEVEQGVCITSNILSRQINASPGDTVGLLSASSPEFLFTWLACLQLGYSVLLIAPECSSSGIVHLCESCEISVLIVDEKNSKLGEESAINSESSSGMECLKSPFIGHNVFDVIKSEPENECSYLKTNDNDIAYYHHTSGTSSGKPKPIPQTHRGSVGVLPALDGKDQATFTTTPLYHGGPADILRAWTSDAMIWLFPSNQASISPANIVRCLNASNRMCKEGQCPPISYFASVPYILQMMSEDASGLQWLKQLDMVSVGGASLPAETGNKLVKNGVNLVSRFGSAECGFLLSSDREFDKDQEWQYLRVPRVSPCLKFEKNGELHELVVLKGWPHLAKTNREDGSYATSDLFEQHPNISNAWKYHSRSDSQMTLITGKKFDPAPLEDAIVAASTMLADALIFGNGKPYPGLLVFRGQTAEHTTDEALVDEVATVVDRLNIESQKHAKIGHDMIFPMPHSADGLQKSSKGTLLRSKAEAKHAAKIEAAYGNGANGDRKMVSDAELPHEIRELVCSAMPREPGKFNDQTDLFSLGVDSVASIRIRNGLQRLMPIETKSLPVNIVDECGTVHNLVEFMRKARTGEAPSLDEATDEQEEMKKMVVKYSKFSECDLRFDSSATCPAVIANRRKSVLLTGSTGLLGSHVLSLLINDESVEQIYCLVRGSDDNDCQARVQESLKQRLLPALLKTSKVVVLRGDAGQRQLGLQDQTYRELSASITHIMHLAWPVNFRMKLRNFENSLVGMQNLINLAVSTSQNECPQVMFCSSVASAMAYKEDIIPESPMDDPSSATNLGYSQSKWVSEQICVQASRNPRLKGKVSLVRVGQLSGNTKTGVWNMKEAWPTLLSSVKVTGVLPNLANEILDWLPVDIAAAAMIDTIDAGHTKEIRVFHVVNDANNVAWSDLLQWMKSKADFDVVTPSEWIDRLDEVAAKEDSHPSLQLLEVWRAAYKTGNKESGNRKTFATDQSKKDLASLRNVKAVDESYFDKLWSWIDASG